MAIKDVIKIQLTDTERHIGGQHERREEKDGGKGEQEKGEEDRTCTAASASWCLPRDSQARARERGAGLRLELQRLQRRHERGLEVEEEYCVHRQEKEDVIDNEDEALYEY